jgi:hypothetical protein
MTGSGRPPALDAVIGRWGQAFIIFYARDRWVAMRRDTGLFFATGTLAYLEQEMAAEITNGSRTPGPVTAGSTWPNTWGRSWRPQVRPHRSGHRARQGPGRRRQRPAPGR